MLTAQGGKLWGMWWTAAWLGIQKGWEKRNNRDKEVKGTLGKHRMDYYDHN